MIHGIILTDNTFNNLNITAQRGTGAHKIASHLRKFDYNIEVVDYCLSWGQKELEILFKRTVSNHTLFLGIGSNLFLDRPQFNNIISWFKQQYPTIPIVLGGMQVLSRTIPCVDYYIEGYAESAMLELLEYLQGKPAQIKWSNKQHNLIDAIRDYGNIDTSDLSIQYIASDFLLPEQSLGLETARGCIFKCKFCTYPLIGKKKIDYLRDVDTIYTELMTNYDKWGTTNYIIAEDTFNDSVEKLEALASAFDKLPFSINFTAYARLDLLMAKPHSVDLLKRMGMRGVHFGIETFSNSAGKLIGKGITGNRVKDGILWWKEQTPNITTVCSMIVGLPTDDSDYIKENVWFSNSGVEHWYWQPLYITDNDKSLHTSEFSREYTKYDLELMTKQEVDTAINDLVSLQRSYNQGQHQYSYEPFVSSNFRDKLGYWKNRDNSLNYFTSIKTSCQLNTDAVNRKLMPWHVFDYVSLGYSITQAQSWGFGNSKYTAEPNADEISERSRSIIKDYKIKKLKFDYGAFYSTSKTPGKKYKTFSISK